MVLANTRLRHTLMPISHVLVGTKWSRFGRTTRLGRLNFILEMKNINEID